MSHYASPAFWDRYSALPERVRALADKNYALLNENPEHPSLHLKRVGRYWSARVGRDYRALGVPADDGILWIWIGPHAAKSRRGSEMRKPALPTRFVHGMFSRDFDGIN